MAVTRICSGTSEHMGTWVDTAGIGEVSEGLGCWTGGESRRYMWRDECKEVVFKNTASREKCILSDMSADGVVLSNRMMRSVSTKCCSFFSVEAVLAAQTKA